VESEKPRRTQTPKEGDTFRPSAMGGDLDGGSDDEITPSPVRVAARRKSFRLISDAGGSLGGNSPSSISRGSIGSHVHSPPLHLGHGASFSSRNALVSSPLADQSQGIASDHLVARSNSASLAMSDLTTSAAARDRERTEALQVLQRSKQVQRHRSSTLVPKRRHRLAPITAKAQMALEDSRTWQGSRSKQNAA